LIEPIGPVAPDHLDRLLALNNAHAAELSLLDAARLASLLQQAFWAARVGDVDAFMLTLDQSADYDSPNHRWFRDRYPRFVYVDRVVVAPAARGRGLARLLYAGVLHAAAAAGHTAIMAEVNTIPPNPASDALHAALGFHEVGAASIHGGAKTVRYLMRTLP
jgi:predicted GNAT superfamily acetyltransferase